MTETTVGTPALVTELDEERRRYENWLEQLEARRGATPDHVYVRVRDDYLQRLRGVVERLGEHAESLRASVMELEQRAEELRAEEQRVRDDRAEAELRAMVGEYAPDQWDAIQGRADEALQELGARRAEAEEELDRLRQLLALATSGATAATTAPVEAAVAPDEPVASLEPASAADDVPVVATPGGLDAPVVPAAGDANGLGDAFGGWSRDLDEDVAPIAEPRATGSRSAEARRESRLDTPVPPTPAASSESGSTAIKTLRCQECGTMNYPTEWYCERCGGELATL